MPLNKLAFLDRATVGDCIRYQRTHSRNSTSQENLAEAIGISPSALSRIERNQRRASPELLERIAKALGVDLSTLVPRERTSMARAG